MFDVAFFDLDGTLVNSGAPIMDSLNDSLLAHGLDPVASSDARRFVGPPLYDTLADLLTERGHDVELVASLIGSYRDSYSQRSLTDTTVYQGIPELLGDLSGHVRLGVVTSKPRPSAVAIIDALGLAGWFELIEGPSLSSPESKSETLHRALGQVGVASNLVVMIGDRRHDIEAGLAHETYTAGVTWGFGDVEELTNAGANRLVDHPEELLSLFGPDARRQRR